MENLKQICVRFTQEQIQQLENEAEERGMKVATLIRHLVVQYFKKDGE